VIVDTSAIIAILKEEPEAEHFQLALSQADDGVAMSAANYFEAAIVVDRNGSALLSQRLDDVLEAFSIAIAPVTESQVRIARAAYRQFGKGSGHPASLNFGDCFAYALATERERPLLFKGNDFGHSDVTAAG
jgi:ribonuclease VapC